jgi:phage terminase small subunit
MKAPNPRQEIFIREYVLGKSAVEAARLAGYREGYARKSAHALTKKPAVAAGIEAAYAKIREQTTVTAGSLMAQLQADHDKAVEIGQMTAAVRASEMMGKLAGLLTDKLRLEVEAKPSLIVAIAAARARAALPAPTIIDAPFSEVFPQLTTAAADPFAAD